MIVDSSDGRLLGTWDVDKVKAVDWEGITTDGRGHLYLGDFAGRCDPYHVSHRAVLPNGVLNGCVSINGAVCFTDKKLKTRFWEFPADAALNTGFLLRGNLPAFRLNSLGLGEEQF